MFMNPFCEDEMSKIVRLRSEGRYLLRWLSGSQKRSVTKKD